MYIVCHFLKKFIYLGQLIAILDSGSQKKGKNLDPEPGHWVYGPRAFGLPALYPSVFKGIVSRDFGIIFYFFGQI
jgi:hypothetical protein